MTTTVPPPQERNWQEQVKKGLKDSSWVTVGWDWLQMLLGRSVDFVLWTTMVFSCYRLVPGAPQPSASVSTFMFIMQFVGLDIGGLGLNRLGQQCGLGRWSYARIVAYILIGITLATVTWSGIEHVLPAMPKEVTGWVEVVLVILRSVMTVLYGQAIHSLKAEDHRQQDRLAELEEQVAVQGVQLSTSQQEVSSLRAQLNSEQQRVSTVQQEVSTLRVQLDREREKVSSLQATLDSQEHPVDREKWTLDTQANRRMDREKWFGWIQRDRARVDRMQPNRQLVNRSGKCSEQSQDSQGEQ